MDFNTLAFIGRFQPFHDGHKAVVDEALRRAEKVAIVIGSHDQPRCIRNPFTTQERIEMISAVYPQETKSGRIRFVPQVNHLYNDDRWIAGVQSGVQSVAYSPFTPGPVRIGLIGHEKDQSSFYLKFFPTWDSIGVPNIDGIDASSIRESFFNPIGVLRNVPAPVLEFLREWEKNEVCERLREEQRFLREYREQWIVAPYPPTFQTVDAVVVQSGHVLLVKRGAFPGRGLWALPGGFVGQHETLKAAALRELREETRLAVPEPVLNGSIVTQQTFDNPHRSQRGRTITTAFYIRLSDREELPKVKGGDDAAKACWVPLSDLRRSMMFEDHFDIIETTVAI